MIERVFALRDIFPLPLRESDAFKAAVVSQLSAVRGLVAAPHLSNG
ncbi:hypothetical protein [Parafrigoribacterium mesophilum]